MTDDKRFLMDVGLRDLPFPIRAISRTSPDGQSTIAEISICARIMQEFEARWIDRFIQILHARREQLGFKALRAHVLATLDHLKATSVSATFRYPFFIEKVTPVSKEKCLVRYRCSYSAKATSAQEPRIQFRIEVPAITTYPISDVDKPGGLFGQLSVVVIEIASEDDIVPEDLVDIVDAHAISPVYSFLTEADQVAIIKTVHEQKKTSVVMTDEIKADLARRPEIQWYAIQCANFGMLHSYSTVIRTEKSLWVPMSGPGEEI